jgi:hypothetical protein
VCISMVLKCLRGKNEREYVFRYHMIMDGPWKISRGCFTKTRAVVCILSVHFTGDGHMRMKEIS